MPDPRRWRMLLWICLAELGALSLWFSATAVIPSLKTAWMSPAAQAWLSMAVTLGFVAGTAISAVLTLADWMGARRLFAVSATGAALMLVLVEDGPHLGARSPFNPRAVAQLVRSRGVVLASAGYFGHRLTGHAQMVFLLLLAIARDEGELSEAAREPTLRLMTDAAADLEAVAVRLRRGGETPAIVDLDAALAAVERAITAHRPLDRDRDEASRGSRPPRRGLRPLAGPGARATRRPRRRVWRCRATWSCRRVATAPPDRQSTNVRRKDENWIPRPSAPWRRPGELPYEGSVATFGGPSAAP